MIRLGIWLDYGVKLVPDQEPIPFLLEFIKEIIGRTKPLVQLVLRVRRSEIPRFQSWMDPDLFRRLEFQINAHGEPPVSQGKDSACDLWLFPYPLPGELKSVPSVVCVPDDSLARLEKSVPGEPQWVEKEEEEFSAFLASATLCVCHSGQGSEVLLDSFGMSPAVVRVLSRQPGARFISLLEFCEEAISIFQLPASERKARLARPWIEEPSDAPQAGEVLPTMCVPDVPEVCLFLPVIYPGGIWQASKDLVNDLIMINQERRELVLSLALPDDEGDPETILRFEESLQVGRFQLDPITVQEGARIQGESLDGEIPRRPHSFMKGCQSQFLRADAWFALTDRFRYPLLPLRLYGVLIYDMIQRHAPETFPPVFFEWSEIGMKPTMERAEFLFTGSESTRQDVLASYHVEPEKVRMVPIATAVGRRFQGLSPAAVPLPDVPYILQVTNIAPHKGAKVMLKGYARLKNALGEKVPRLVICGYGTELFSPASQERKDEPVLKEVRKLIQDLGLLENRDVHFLGFVSDSQLMTLYQKANLVVNAARYDLGTLCAIEARYFGKPVVSSRYPAIVEMARRFDLPLHFFEVENDLDLARNLEKALQSSPIYGQQLEGIRSALDDSHLTHRHYAQQIYKLLVDMGRKGQNLRQEKRKTQNHF